MAIPFEQRKESKEQQQS